MGHYCIGGNNWDYKLACRSAKKLISTESEPKLETDGLDESKEQKPVILVKGQFDFGF